MTLMMTSAQVVETSVNVTNNSPSRDYSHPDDQTTQTLLTVLTVTNNSLSQDYSHPDDQTTQTL